MRNVLVHAHIFKNAGTTFDFTLKNNFGEAFVDHREDERFLEGKNAYLLEYLKDNSGLKALSSHSLHFRITGDNRVKAFPFNFFNSSLNLVPVYFLRHPLARVWSVYNFEKTQSGADTEGARRAKELGLNDYVSWYLEEGSPATIRNIHTIFLSGDGPSPDRMDEKFNAASLYLNQGSALFPIVERYDDSMLVLEEKLKDYFPGLDLSYVRKNISAENPDQQLESNVSMLLSSLDEEVAEKLQKANAFDVSLYKQASERLDEELAQISDLERKKADLLGRCRKLQGA